MRAFADDMAALAKSHLTTFTQESIAGRPGRRWIAGDMMLTPSGDFLTGVRGFTEQQQQVSFDDDAFSWMKAQVEESDAASDQTIVPFAVDLRDSERWVAFATTNRLPENSFRRGFENVLNHAVAQLGLMPTAWEVDLVTSTGVIREWLQRNPLVYRLRRVLKPTNPGKSGYRHSNRGSGDSIRVSRSIFSCVSSAPSGETRLRTSRLLFSPP